MKLSFRATIIIDMKDPKKWGYDEPCITSLIKLINSKKVKASLATKLFIEPVIIVSD